MNAPAFTPGPWHANAIAKGRIIGDETAKGAEKIHIAAANCTVAVVCRSRDATIIKAAPELYTAAAAVASIELPPLTDENAALQYAILGLRAALAKATRS